MTAALRRGTRARHLAIVLAALLVTACAPAAPAAGSPTSSPAASGAPDRTPDGGNGTTSPSALFDDSAVHDLSISFDQAAYEAMIARYRASGDKEWIEATVTIDGKAYERAGIRLKGNSSLGGLGAGAGGGPNGGTDEKPESLPWLISLDRFVDGQSHDGVAEFVVRSNSSKTALNEAVALELLERAGLASQDAVAVRFSVNGGDEVLRLVIEHLDDAWMSRWLSATGALYKAESTGDYSYRGDDPEAYDEVFDQEAGEENADLAPLIEFLKFINEADDATFAAEIEQRLNVDAFATYLAMQELVANWDDIDGPGNNSYLYYDPATGQFTIVPWDYNLAFEAGGMIVRGPGERGPDGGHGAVPVPGASFQPPVPDGSFQPPVPDGSFQPRPGDFVEEPVDGGPEPGAGGVKGHSNILSKRFLEIEKYRDLVEARKAELTKQLFDGGVAADVLAQWVAALEAEAADLVDAKTIETESKHVASQF